MSKVKLIILVCVIQVLFLKGQAPFFSWVQEAPGSNTGTVFAFDALNNVYIASSFGGTFDFDRGPATYTLSAKGSLYTDAYIGKYDQAGNFLWAKKFGDTLSENHCSIQLDGSGNIYTAGNFYGTVDFDPGAGTTTITAQSQDNYVTKWDGAGNFIWAKAFIGFGLQGNTNMVADALGNTYTCGWFSNATDFDPGSGTYSLTPYGSSDGYVVKLDPSGNFVWAVQFGGSSLVQPLSISRDPSGNLFVGGLFYNTADFDPGPGTFNLTSNGGEDAFLVKLNTSGSFIWAKNFGGTVNDEIYSLAADGTGNIISVGSFSSSVADFDPGPSTFTMGCLGVTDVFVSKLDASGNFIFAKRIGNTGYERPRCVALNASGDIYFNGNFDGLVDFDPGPGVTSYSSTNSNTDVFVEKLDANGNFMWVRKFGGTQGDYPLSIGLDFSNKIYSSGIYGGTVDFDPGPGTFTMTASSSTGCFTQQLCEFSCPLNIAEESVPPVIRVFPNPNNGSFRLINKMENSEIIITDLLGRKLFSEKLAVGENEITILYLASGLYYCSIIQNGSKKGSGKIVIE